MCILNMASQRIVGPVVREIGLFLTLAAGVQAVVPAQEGPRRLEEPQDFVLPGGSRVEFRSFYAPSLQREMQCSVFVPPGYDDGRQPFPVVLFLHGLWNDHTSWVTTRYGNLPAVVEELMLNGEIPRCLVVHPNGENGFYTDSLDGTRRYEQELVEDLPQFIREHYRVSKESKDWVVGGVSVGGYGALKLGLKYPERFAAVAAASPIVLRADVLEARLKDPSNRFAQYLAGVLRPVFGLPIDPRHWEENDLLELARKASPQTPPIWIVYGAADRYNSFFPLQESIHALVRELQSRDVECTYVEDPQGPHGWELVMDHLKEMLLFLTAPFRPEDGRT